MELMNGVVLIKEVVVVSLAGACLLAVLLLAFVAMAFGGIRLHMNGCRNFSDGEKIFGFVISMVGLALDISFLLLMRYDAVVPLLDSFGLTDHTGKYEVTLTANVDMNEFQECYEIIDYENGVYTIKAKGN